MNEKEIARDYKTIREDYRFDDDIFSDEPEKVAALKYIIDKRLNQVDRTLIILYTDCQSYRALGKRLGLSHQTIGQEIRRIKANIIKEYQKLKENERH